MKNTIFYLDDEKFEAAILEQQHAQAPDLDDDFDFTTTMDDEEADLDLLFITH